MYFMKSETMWVVKYFSEKNRVTALKWSRTTGAHWSGRPSGEREMCTKTRQHYNIIHLSRYRTQPRSLTRFCLIFSYFIITATFYYIQQFFITHIWVIWSQYCLVFNYIVYPREPVHFDCEQTAVLLEH